MTQAPHSLRPLAPEGTALRKKPANAPWKRFGRHFFYVMSENPVTAAAFLLFFGIIVLAIFGPAIAPYDPLATNASNALQPPSRAHPFGTD